MVALLSRKDLHINFISSWSEWMKTHEAVQHLGHPDVFNFDYIYNDFA